MIYDCFTFFNEIDLLELRLETLDRVVDRWVLVESTRTHSGHDKPLYFAESLARFARFNERIIHVIVDDNPDGSDSWIRERHQRDAIMRGLSKCLDSDLVMVSDLDEIPDPRDVMAASKQDGISVFEHRNCYYFLNAMNGFWHGTRSTSYRQLRVSSPNDLRASTGSIFPQSGWHYSFFGGVRLIQQKLKSYAHQEYNTASVTDPHRLKAAIATGTDLFGRTSVRFRLLANKHLPIPVQSNRARFSEYLVEQFQTTTHFHVATEVSTNPRLALAALELSDVNSGHVISIGDPDGRLCVQFAIAIAPQKLDAVGVWNCESHPLPYSMVAHQSPASEYETFLRNMLIATSGNFQAICSDPIDYFKVGSHTIRFCYISDCSDPKTVMALVKLIQPRMVPGGVLCGSYPENSRRVGSQSDTSDSLDQVLREALPELAVAQNFWWWQAAPRSGESLKAVGHYRTLSKLKHWKSVVGGLMQFVCPTLYIWLQDRWWAMQSRKRMRQWSAKTGR